MSEAFAASGETVRGVASMPKSLGEPGEMALRKARPPRVAQPGGVRQTRSEAQRHPDIDGPPHARDGPHRPHEHGVDHVVLHIGAAQGQVVAFVEQVVEPASSRKFPPGPWRFSSTACFPRDSDMLADRPTCPRKQDCRQGCTRGECGRLWQRRRSRVCRPAERGSGLLDWPDLLPLPLTWTIPTTTPLSSFPTGWPS